MSLPSIESSLQYGFERNKELFESNFEQPLIMAVQGPNPACALELIKHGADVNAMTKESRQALKRGRHGFKCQTVLDNLRQSRRRLQMWEAFTATAPASRINGIDEVLADFQEGTWQHATVKTTIDRAKKCNEADLEIYEKTKARRLGLEEGIQLKKAAIDSAIATLKQIENEVIAKGGQKFKELHPDFLHENNPKIPHVREPQDLPRFKAEFPFYGVSDLTEKRRAKYIEL